MMQKIVDDILTISGENPESVTFHVGDYERKILGNYRGIAFKGLMINQRRDEIIMKTKTETYLQKVITYPRDGKIMYKAL